MGERAASQNGAQTLTFEQLRNDVRRAVLLADVMNRENIRVVKSGDRTRFLLEAAKAVGISGERSGKDLDGNIATQAVVAGAIDFAHSA